MASGLVRRITQFRYLGYVMLGFGLVVTEFEWRRHEVLIFVLSLAWPACLHACAKGIAGNQHRLRVLQAVENFAVPLCAALFQFPLVQLMALLVSLLSGNVAQGGLKRVPEALMAAAFGWLAGDWGLALLAVAPYFEASSQSDVIGYAHLLLFTSLISAAGYDRSLEMHASRSQLVKESTQLRAFCGRIAKYVGPGLTQRLLNTAGPQLPHQRVWISACFVDLVGFTHMTSRLAPEAVCETLNLFLGRIAALAKGQGGRVDKFLGDGVLITFGDLEDAVAGGCLGQRPTRKEIANAMMFFAKRVSPLLDAMNRDLDGLALPTQLQARMGGASGYCTVGDFGQGERLDYTVIGPAVNLASRLEALAPVGAMLIDEATHRLASGESHRRHWDTRQVKGFPEDLELWLVA